RLAAAVEVAATPHFTRHPTVALSLAACVAELQHDTLRAVRLALISTPAPSPYPARAARRWLRTSAISLSATRERALRAFVALQGAPQRALAHSLVRGARIKTCVAHRHEDDAVRCGGAFRVAHVSDGARALVLALALVVVRAVPRARARATRPEMCVGVVTRLLADVGDTLVRALGVHKLAYRQAAQLWVDLSYVQTVVTAGADAELPALHHALDPLCIVKERAVQAVLADGFSFSLADMNALRELVVLPELARCTLLCQCFEETWRSVALR
ncbi:unnamed protein product, partial [Agarophyton chilense]